MPNPGVRFAGVGGSTTHTIDANGLRFTGQRPFSDAGSILAVGDSFTYGDEVSDEEAWPARLQRLTGRRVLNGGVTGYGFDQIVLRAEQLTALHRPSVIVVSFIEDDLRRTEARRLWWRDKPWFAIEDGQLVLKGVPVPQRTLLPREIRHHIGEVLVTLPSWLKQAVGYNTQVHPRGHGQVIAPRLVERLARLRGEHGVKIVVMAQYEQHVWSDPRIAADHRGATQAVLDAATGAGLSTLDTFPRFATEPKPGSFYNRWHMNARGNSAVASLLAARLPALLESQALEP